MRARPAKVSKTGLLMLGSSACLSGAYCLIDEIKPLTNEKVNGNKFRVQNKRQI